MELRTGLLAIPRGAGRGADVVRTLPDAATLARSAHLYVKQDLSVAQRDTVKGQPLPGSKLPRVHARHPGPVTA